MSDVKTNPRNLCFRADRI